MRPEDVRVLFDYLYWLRDRTLTAAADVSIDELTSPDVVTTRNLNDIGFLELARTSAKPP
jgi:hypothetical protein